MKVYELKPTTSQKSFYGKAIVQVDNNGNETLYSYNTPIIKKYVDGTYKKLWDGWTATTGKHIRSFCGLSKAEFMGLDQGVYNMKKFNAIIREVKQTQQKINEVEEKIKQLRKTYLNIMDIKKRHEKMKTVENELMRLEEKKKDLQITIKILNSNAKIALYNETLPIVLEVLAKYKNKSYGPKTDQKIKNEIKEKTNCSFYISDRYTQEYHIIPLEFSNNDYNIEFGTKYENGKQKKLLIDNKIQVPELKDLTIYYSSKEYIDNIPKRIKDLKRLYKKAYEKQKELDAICSEYNSLTVGSIKNIYKDKNIYPNMDI